MSDFAFLSRWYRLAFRSKGFIFINIAGLAIGLAIAMFLLVYLQFEFSFDRHFKDADRIYRVLTVWGEQGQDITPLCFDALATRLQQEIPEVEIAGRVYDRGYKHFYERDEQKLKLKTLMVDSAFLKIFNFQNVYGQYEQALFDLNQCLVTRSAAERFWGKEVNPLGKTLTSDEVGNSFQVSAVIEDVPDNTHFDFDILVLLPDFGYGGLEYYTYLKFKTGMHQKEAVEKCNALNKKMLEERFGEFMKGRFDGITEPLLDLHTSTRAAFDLSPTVNKSNLFLIVIVVIFVMGIAISNFIALYIVRGERRAMEISIRKTNGANRGKIMRMLWGETFLVTSCAFFIAVLLYYGLSSLLVHWLGFHLPAYIGISGQMWLEFVVLYGIVSIIVGGYPAWYLSRFSPAELIRKSGARKYRLTIMSVIVQFTVVVFCISSLLVIIWQMDYIRKLPLGFQTENILQVKLNFTKEKFKVIQSDLLQYPYILKVAAGQVSPVGNGSGNTVWRMDQAEKESIGVDQRRVAPGYLDLYEIPLVAGREVNENEGVEQRYIVVSESTVADLDLKDPVGQKIYFVGDAPWTIIGVARDVLVSAHEKTERMVYSFYTGNLSFLAVKYVPGKYEEAKKVLLKTLDKHYKGIPVYVSDAKTMVDNTYWQDRVTMNIIMGGTILAIVLALLGLLALTGFVASQKRKEISIRRVCGAQVENIIGGLNRYIFIRVLPAVPLGILVSYYVMNRWLDTFEYARPFVWWILVLAIIVTFMVVLLATFYQIIKAATANPVDALKAE